MNRLSAHIGYLYTDLPLAERPAAAARDGFTAIEHPEPWALPAKEMRALLADLGLTFSQVTSGMGDAGKGEKGLAALTGRETEFRAGFDRALDYAVAIGCPFVHPMAGVPKGGVLDAAETYRLNLSWALSRVEGSGVRVLVEAITIPGYHMGSLALAAQLHDQFHGRFDLLFDTYHATVLAEDPARWAAQNARRIGHVHIADHPGRHEPGTGALAFDRILTALRDHGYVGAIGFEYVPSVATSASAAFLPGWKRLLSEKVSS
ncbi:hydroxypyruvate isomerase [Rhizobium petrolearium]|uniref:hydroxypyruvate isomerase family protein n=1 Tax=Neorhizobium petrolearium TaxID=515361 RepID=UPI001AEAFEF7|nr:TIM barrel protein [Neorhizobium petrolearium]MBP1847637.1 hydroxypyruvate isomerase [Neorhizobium petrolearium]